MPCHAMCLRILCVALRIRDVINRKTCASIVNIWSAYIYIPALPLNTYAIFGCSPLIECISFMLTQAASIFGNSILEREKKRGKKHFISDSFRPTPLSVSSHFLSYLRFRYSTSFHLSKTVFLYFKLLGISFDFWRVHQNDVEFFLIICIECTANDGRRARTLNLSNVLIGRGKRNIQSIRVTATTAMKVMKRCFHFSWLPREHSDGGGGDGGNDVQIYHIFCDNSS